MSEATNQPVPRWRSSIAAIIRHARRPQVLLLRDALPLLDFEPLVYVSDADRLAGELRGTLGCEAILLGSAWGKYEPAARLLRAASVFVLPDEGWTPPPEARWTTELTSLALPWSDQSLREAVDTLLALPVDALVPRRSPWARPGFFEQAGAWVTSSLAGTPWQPVAPVQQFRCWGISCVLRAATAMGDVYFKAAGGSDLFADEPAVMAALGQHYAALVPMPLAREAERRWMLLPDLGTTLRQSGDVELRVPAMTAYGRMQVALAGQVEQLLAAGLHDRRLHALPAQLQALLDDAYARAILGDELYARLAAAAPSLLRVCEQLSEYNIPASVVHGDLHAGNVAVLDGKFQVFDWTDASVAHPFLDLVTFSLISSEVPEGAALVERMVTEYLRLWEPYEPAARLREAWRLAGVAGALHQVISYRHILAGLEPASRWENADGLTEFAVELLEKLEGLSAAGDRSATEREG